MLMAMDNALRTLRYRYIPCRVFYFKSTYVYIDIFVLLGTITNRFSMKSEEIEGERFIVIGCSCPVDNIKEFNSFYLATY